MSTRTPKLGLYKSSLSDFANIENMNENWDKIDDKLSGTSNSIVLTTGGWTLGDDGRYHQTVDVESVTANTEIILVDVDLSTNNTDEKISYLEAWQTVSANEVTQGEGTLTFYTWELPTVNVPVNVGVL